MRGTSPSENRKLKIQIKILTFIIDFGRNNIIRNGQIHVKKNEASVTEELVLLR